MGEVVHNENVLDPTCGEMFNKFRNVFKETDYREGGFYFDGTLVARIITADIQLNGEMLTWVRIIEKGLYIVYPEKQLACSELIMVLQ